MVIEEPKSQSNQRGIIYKLRGGMSLPLKQEGSQ